MEEDGQGEATPSSAASKPSVPATNARESRPSAHGSGNGSWEARMSSARAPSGPGARRRPPPLALPPHARPVSGSGGWHANLASDHVAFLVFFVGQCLIWASALAQADTWAAKMQPALVAVLTFIGLAVSTRAPRFYWRHR